MHGKKSPPAFLDAEQHSNAQISAYGGKEYDTNQQGIAKSIEQEDGSYRKQAYCRKT